MASRAPLVAPPAPRKTAISTSRSSEREFSPIRMFVAKAIRHTRLAVAMGRTTVKPSLSSLVPSHIREGKKGRRQVRQNSNFLSDSAPRGAGTPHRFVMAFLGLPGDPPPPAPPLRFSPPPDCRWGMARSRALVSRFKETRISGEVLCCAADSAHRVLPKKSGGRPKPGTDSGNSSPDSEEKSPPRLYRERVAGTS